MTVELTLGEYFIDDVIDYGYWLVINNQGFTERKK